MDKFLIRYPNYSAESNPKGKSQRKALSPIQVFADEKTPFCDTTCILAEKAKAVYKKSNPEGSAPFSDQDPPVQELTCTKLVCIDTQTEELDCSCKCHFASTAGGYEAKARGSTAQEQTADDRWELEAEEHRVTLEETLHENTELHEKIRQLKQDIDDLTLLASDTDRLVEALKAYSDDSGIVADQTTESDLSHVQEDDNEQLEEESQNAKHL